jgi:hypothetical protein
MDVDQPQRVTVGIGKALRIGNAGGVVMPPVTFPTPR